MSEAPETNTAATMRAGKDVGAVIQTVAILRVLARAPLPMGVTAVAKAAQLNPSTTLNILRTLVKEGLVALHPTTKTYALDLGIVELARTMLGKTHIELLNPRLQQISNQFEATISIWRVTDTDRLLLIERVKPEAGVHIEFAIAMRLPRFAGAGGRAVAAVTGIPAARLQRAFDKIRWTNALDFDTYLEEVEQARQLGYAFDHGQLIKSVVSVAAVIPDQEGRPALVINAHTFNGQLSSPALHALGQSLWRTCQETRAALYGT